MPNRPPKQTGNRYLDQATRNAKKFIEDINFVCPNTNTFRCYACVDNYSDHLGTKTFFFIMLKYGESILPLLLHDVKRKIMHIVSTKAFSDKCQKAPPGKTGRATHVIISSKLLFEVFRTTTLPRWQEKYQK